MIVTWSPGCLASMASRKSSAVLIGLTVDGHDQVGRGAIDVRLLVDKRPLTLLFFSIRGPCSPARSAGPPGTSVAINSP